MIDLHVHILPRLDDGAANLDDALEMAELAVESGVKELVATPHSNQIGRFENFYSASLKTAFQMFQKALERECIPLKTYLGMEILASEDLQEKIISGRLIGLNHSNNSRGTVASRGILNPHIMETFLVEFPFDADPFWIGEQLEAILDIGKRPLIAHPERYACVQDFPQIVYEWLGIGCLTQLNKGSAFGRFGRQVARTSDILLLNDLISCIASDGHSPYKRTTYMGDIWDYIEECYGENIAYHLLEENPRKILEGRTISPHGRPPEGKKYFFNKYF